MVYKDVSLCFSDYQWSQIKEFMTTHKGYDIDDPLSLKTLITHGIDEYIFQEGRREKILHPDCWLITVHKGNMERTFACFSEEIIPLICDELEEQWGPGAWTCADGPVPFDASIHETYRFKNE